MYLEIELKLKLDPEHTALLFNHPLLEQSNPPAEELISRYFDTADLSLWRQGLALRTREAEGRTIQTLKTVGEQIGDLYHRHEWDQPIEGLLPLIHGFEDQEVSKKLDSIIGQRPLKELFHTRFKRTQWNINVPPASTALENEITSNTPFESTELELVLDQGVVSTGTHSMPLHEIELELKKGDANQLYKVAELLKKTIPLTLETRSKAERGYLLYTDNNLSAVHA